MGRPESAGRGGVDDVISEALAHHGVKGMKWGVRHDPGHTGERAKTKTIAKADKKFEKAIATANAGRVTPELHNAAVSRMNARIRDVNDSPKYRSKDMDRATGKIKEEYDRDMQKAIVSSFEDATREVYGSNASGTKMGVYNAKEDRIDIVDRAAKHADSPPQVPDVSVLLTRNKTGHVVGIKVVPLKEEGQLAHYGVKGMHWGIRKDRSTGVPSGEARVTQKKAGGKLTSEGGKGFPAHSDAIRTARTKQIAKNSGLHALSNIEIQQAVARMNLEQQYTRLSKPQKNAGSRFIGQLFGTVAKQQATKVANDLAAQQVAQALKKNSQVSHSDIDSFLAHHGIKGMKWGVRKDRESGGSTQKAKPVLKGVGPDTISKTTKHGDTITLQKDPPMWLDKFRAKHSDKFVNDYNNSAWFHIRDPKGRNVGDALIQKRSSDELYLNWITVNRSARGKGYATAVLRAAEDFGAKEGFKKMTLEVPGKAPDARHIYENLGFKVTHEPTAKEVKDDPVWGGLTSMEYTFNNVKHDSMSPSSKSNDYNLEDVYGDFLDAFVKHLNANPDGE